MIRKRLFLTKLSPSKVLICALRSVETSFRRPLDVSLGERDDKGKDHANGAKFQTWTRRPLSKSGNSANPGPFFPHLNSLLSDDNDNNKQNVMDETTT